jgi:hypothetical protein
MPRTLTVLFRRDPRRDCRHGNVAYEGYQILLPDGRRVTVGIEGFCQRGQRLLGLGRYLAGLPERLIELDCYPLADVEEPLTRLPGSRVRRLYLERSGGLGRLHFLDGTPPPSCSTSRGTSPASWTGSASPTSGTASGNGSTWPRTPSNPQGWCRKEPLHENTPL